MGTQDACVCIVACVRCFRFRGDRERDEKKKKGPLKMIGFVHYGVDKTLSVRNLKREMACVQLSK